MPSIASFRGLRYDPAHVGAIAQVIAPPADAIDSILQTQLYEQHPANVVRLELNREEPGDGQQNNSYTRAAKFLKAWRDQGVLMQEPVAALYVYHQLFEAEAQPFTRRGFMARVRLEPFGIGPLQQAASHSSREDRLKLTQACRANFCPVLGRYPDPEGEVQAMLDAAVSSQPAIEATDILGVTNQLWPMTDETVVAKVAGLIGPRPLTIAAGLTQYEAAGCYRDEVAAAHAADNDGAQLPTDHPANFMLMMLVCSDAEDEQLLAAAGLDFPPPASGLVISLLD
jgi:uncharacterized protein (DUF1015 family)